MENNLIDKDHDLLIELRTEMRSLRADISELKSGLASRIKDLEDFRATKSELSVIKKDTDGTKLDHEKRIRQLEKYGALAAGALFIIQLVWIYLTSKGRI
jgi:hypothetical protein